MSNEQWRTIIWGALGFLVPQLIIWGLFALRLLMLGKLHGS